MAKQGQRAEVNTFIQGLITEASPLNFPPNASKDEENFILRRDGTRKRRLGIDSITVENLSPDTFESLTSGINSFVWTSVNGNPDQEILVVQFKSNLMFYSLDGETPTYLNTLAMPFDDNIEFSFTCIEGKLVVVGAHPSVVVVTYVDGTTFTNAVQLIKVRDFWGIEVV